jgi:hypothetical protein
MKRPLAKLELTATGALLLAGAWLAVSPLLVGYTRLEVASWHNALAGLAVIVLAVLLHTRPARRTLPAAGLVGLGVWLLLAPWLLGYGSLLVRDSEPGQATWNGPSPPQSCWPPPRSTPPRSAGRTDTSKAERT